MKNSSEAAEAVGRDGLCFEDGQRLVDPHELAARLNVPVGWVYQRTRERSIPFVKVGHYCRFDFGEVVAWLRRTGGKAQRQNRSLVTGS